MFQVLTIVRIVYLFATIGIFRKLIDFSLMDYLKFVIFPIAKVLVLSGVLSMFISTYIGSDLWGIFLMTVCCVVITILCIGAVGMSKGERKSLVCKICKLFNR